MSNRTGILLLVSGPSGSGKTTLCRKLADESEAIYSTSCTTRPPRDGEKHAHDYYFLSKEEFTNRVDNGDFLEHAEVHGNFYGTLKSEVINHLNNGTDVVMDIDVQGAELVRNCKEQAIQTALVDLFVMPSTEDELYQRLSGRGTDTEDVITLRMKNALEEMTHWQKYSYRLMSRTREEDYHQFKSLLIAQRMRVSRIKP